MYFDPEKMILHLEVSHNLCSTFYDSHSIKILVGMLSWTIPFKSFTGSLSQKFSTQRGKHIIRRQTLMKHFQVNFLLQD
jgi:hypothetical protein